MFDWLLKITFYFTFHSAMLLFLLSLQSSRLMWVSRNTNPLILSAASCSGTIEEHGEKVSNLLNR